MAKRILLAAFLALVALTFVDLHAAKTQIAPPSLSWVPVGYQQITTALSGSTALTVPAGATMAVFSVETAGVRWRDDGTAPTTTVGMPIAAAAPPVQYNGTLSAIRFIAQTGSPVLNVSYYR